MKVWIIGTGGMLGSCLLEMCQMEGIDAIGSLRSDVDVIDLPALEKFAARAQPTLIVNCAAYTNVDGAEKEKERAFAVNALGAENSALVAKKRGAKLVHVSTDYVFNGKGTQPYREEDVCAPINAYGASKWEGEQRILAVDPEACIVRTSWLFGGKGKNFISSVLSRILSEEEISAVDDQCGKPTYCRHLAKALLELKEYSGIIHFAGGTACSRYQMAVDTLAEAKRRALAIKCKRIVPVSSNLFPTPAPRPKYSVLGTEKYSTLFNRQPPSWEKALTDFFNDEQLF